MVFDLPGCDCSAPDEPSARGLLPVVIAEHIAWLSRHGDLIGDAFPFEVEVVERVEVLSLGDAVADGEFCFQDDLRASTREEMETVTRRLASSRQDLLATVRHLPDRVLDWQPPATAVRQDEWAAGVRSIRRILGHIAGSESYYAGNVGEAFWKGAMPGETPSLVEERSRALERLVSLSDAELGAEFKKRQSWQDKGWEHWTVRKALRRLISHERFHTKEIEQQLAWLLVGAPQLATSSVRVALMTMQGRHQRLRLLRPSALRAGGPATPAASKDRPWVSRTSTNTRSEPKWQTRY